MAKTIDKNHDHQFELEVTGKERISHDVYLFELSFPDPETISGAWPGSHFKLCADIAGNHVSRPYSTISSVGTKGKMDFLIKIYRPDQTDARSGLFTTYLEENVDVGDSILVEGPLGKIKYRGYGIFDINGKSSTQQKIKRFGMLGAGTGVTPLFSLAQASVMSGDGVDITMVLSNKTKNDILCKPELDNLVKFNSKKFKIHHTLTRHNNKFHGMRAGLTGRITKDMLKEIDFPLKPDKETMIFVCGPMAFEGHCLNLMVKQGWELGVNLFTF